jgi:segregation and condensation protein B
MGTVPAVGEIIADLKKTELSVALSRGALETLVIILYHTHISKSEIDYIRGVNSQFMLRNLLLRGLIEKTESETDKRISVYRVTIETLQWLGITQPTQLPDYAEFHNEMEQALIQQ